MKNKKKKHKKPNTQNPPKSNTKTKNKNNKKNNRKQALKERQIKLMLSVFQLFGVLHITHTHTNSHTHTHTHTHTLSPIFFCGPTSTSFALKLISVYLFTPFFPFSLNLLSFPPFCHSPSKTKTKIPDFDTFCLNKKIFFFLNVFSP